MFSKIKRMAMDLEREEGRVEGRVEGKQEGREEGMQEGRQEGRVEGRQEAEAAFQAWIRRQEAAGNLTIDESDPPPQ